MILPRRIVRTNYFLYTQKRFKYKKKWAVNLKKKQPVDLALGHFDQFYKPVFGRLWSSIRVALLTQHKYCALVNNFASSEDIALDLLSNGALDIQENVGDLFDVEGQSIDFDWERNDSDSKHIEETELNDIVGTDAASDLYSFVPTEPVMSERERLVKKQSEQGVLSKCDGAYFECVEETDFEYPRNLKVHSYTRGDTSRFSSPKQDETNMLNYFLMDGGSILPVLALELKRHCSVLDMCAAPGGKALAILQTLLPGQLVCMDTSYQRLKRLYEILHFYVPSSFLSDGKVEVIQSDGVQCDGSKRLFDRVLVDVPCTNDRHSLLENDNNIFQPGRMQERLGITTLQQHLLRAAINSCKVGGTIVYSTCSLSPAQNDGVVHMTLQHFWENSRTELVVAKPCKMVDDLRHVFKFYAGRYGYLVLPTLQANFGPMYVCKLKKVG